MDRTLTDIATLRKDLQQYAKKLLPPSHTGRLPRTAIVTLGDGSRYKLRRYPGKASARAIEKYLSSLSRRVAVVPPVFRQDDLLAFEYVDMGSVPDEARPPFALGRFLGQVAETMRDGLDEMPVAESFERELNTLVQVGFITARAARDTKLWFERLRPVRPAIELAYWDAMPHNFGWVGGEFTLLDEKHLRPGYAGVSLVKPSLTFRNQDWVEVCAGYSEVADVAQFDEHLDFLTLNYLVGALNFYALQWIDGRRDVPKNHRMRRYRQALNRRISSNPAQQHLETFGFLLRFPSASVAEFRRRVRKNWRRRLGKQDEKGGTQEAERLTRYRHV